MTFRKEDLVQENIDELVEFLESHTQYFKRSLVQELWRIAQEKGSIRAGGKELKKIIIKVGTTNNKCYEQGLHPKDQVTKVINQEIDSDLMLYTNSAYVIEAFNQYHKEHELIFYLDNELSEINIVSDSLSKPFEKLLFDE